MNDQAKHGLQKKFAKKMLQIIRREIGQSAYQYLHIQTEYHLRADQLFICQHNLLISTKQLCHMTEQIAGYLFDLSKPIYLLHPNNKFWEATLNGLSVKYRVGKIKDGTENGIESVEKDYPSHSSAKASVITKTQQKMTKGYYTKDAKPKQKVEEQKNKKGQGLKKKPQIKQIDAKTFSGQYYQKGKQAIKIQVNGKRVKLTRYDESGRQKYQIRAMQNYDQAVQFCLKQEQWILGEGYKANNSKFIYSFVNDEQPKADQKTTKRKDPSKANSNFLSITKMTDDAISHRSRNTSECKSDRSFKDNGSDDPKYLPSLLGNPTSECIKVLLAETWSDDVDPKGWIMSEKLDGVRMFWTGTTMFSRNGNRFYFPKFFTKNWPKSQLDGELFIDRGQFSKTISAVKKTNPIDSEWQNVRFLVFDCPGLKKPFKTRIKMMEETIKSLDNSYIKCHAHRQCNGYDDLFQQLDRVNKIEGEGLMLRDPQSYYENRRSKTLLKVKTFYDDQAVVLGYTQGTGRCYGMVGSLKVRNTHGVQFEVGSGMTDAIRRKPPKIGSKITYKYQQFVKSSGKPRFPTFLRAYDQI